MITLSLIQKKTLYNMKVVSEIKDGCIEYSIQHDSYPCKSEDVEFEGTLDECKGWLEDWKEQYEFECNEALSSIGSIYFG